MGTPPTFICLIIDPRSDNRRRLKEAIGGAQGMSVVSMVSDPADGLKHIDAGEGIDLVFVADRFERAEVSRFVQAAHKRQNTQDAAYILLLDNDASDTQRLAGSVLDGFDGFLVEPYSMLGLLEVVEIAARVKKERREARLRLALYLLVQELSAQHSQVTRLQRGGGPARIGRQILDEMSGVLKQLDERDLELYYDVAVNYFTSLPAPPAERTVRSSGYRGASERVRERLSRKAVDQFRAVINSKE